MFYKTQGMTRAWRKTKGRPHILRMLLSILLLKEKQCKSTQTTPKQHWKKPHNEITHTAMRQSLPPTLVQHDAHMQKSLHARSAVKFQLWPTCLRLFHVTAQPYPSHPTPAAGTERSIPCIFSSDGKKTWLWTHSLGCSSASHSSCTCSPPAPLAPPSQGSCQRSAGLSLFLGVTGSEKGEKLD